MKTVFKVLSKVAELPGLQNPSPASQQSCFHRNHRLGEASRSIGCPLYLLSFMMWGLEVWSVGYFSFSLILIIRGLGFDFWGCLSLIGKLRSVVSGGSTGL